MNLKCASLESFASIVTNSTKPWTTQLKTLQGEVDAVREENETLKHSLNLHQVEGVKNAI